MGDTPCAAEAGSRESAGLKHRSDQVQHRGVTLVHVPTEHPRRSVTETPAVRAALNSLRERGERVRLSDLIIRGANARLHELDAARLSDSRRQQLRDDLVRRLRTGAGLDPDAAHEVRESGWTH
jgi:hypothetical protein